MARASLLIILLVVLVGPTRYASAQADSGRYGVLVEGQGVLPVMGLADRFDPFPTLSIGIGRETNPQTYWEVRLQRYDFPRANQLTLLPDTTRPAAIGDSLDLSLEITGAGLFMQRKLASTGRLLPFVTVGAGFYYWTDVRGSYETDGLLLEREERSQWSGGFHGGLGSEVLLTRKIALQAVIDYTIMFGELWPTLSIGLENVSTFQFASGRLGIRYYF